MESFVFMDKQNWDYNLVYETLIVEAKRTFIL